MKQLFTLLIFGLTSLYAQTVPSYVPTNGLVGWWPFNGNANDESGNSINGVVTGASLGIDRFNNVNKAYSFSQNGDRISLPEISALLGAPNTSSTYSMWFKGLPINPNSYSTGQILSAYESTWSYAIRFEVTSNIAPFNSGLRNKVYYRCPAENDEPTDSSVYDPNVWHHIVVVIDATIGTYSYYFDGVLKSFMSFGYSPTNNYFASNRVWRIGGIFPQPNSVPHQFIGLIDDIAIWTRALSYSELTALHNGCLDSISLEPQNFTAYTGVGWANFKCESSDTAATFQWQQNIGGGWSNISNFGNYTGAISDSLVITGVTASMNNYGYRCIVSSCTTDTSDVAVLTVTEGIGLGESTLDNLTISPNPTNGFISLNGTVVLGTYELLTIDGRVLESGTVKKEYDLTTYPKGVYHLRLSTDEGTRVLKVVKN